MGINKVQYGNTTLIDLTSDTVTADKLMQGYTAHDRTGALITGTATGGGSVTQDQDGFIILPPDGGGSPSVGGLVYETGTWTPSEDVSSYTISFTNTHTVAPFYYMIADATDSYSDATASCYSTAYYNFHQLFGAPFYSNDTGSYVYGLAIMYYRNTSTTSLQGSSPTQLLYPYTNSGSGSNTYSRYWATETGIKAYTNSTSRYWRTGRTYKWIAVWAPTT